MNNLKVGYADVDNMDAGISIILHNMLKKKTYTK